MSKLDNIVREIEESKEHLKRASKIAKEAGDNNGAGKIEKVAGDVEEVGKGFEKIKDKNKN